MCIGPKERAIYWLRQVLSKCLLGVTACTEMQTPVWNLVIQADYPIERSGGLGTSVSPVSRTVAVVYRKGDPTSAKGTV